MLDDKNQHMVDFLEFYIAHAQIWFHTFCAAEGYRKPAKSTCGAARMLDTVAKIVRYLTGSTRISIRARRVVLVLSGTVRVCTLL